MRQLRVFAVALEDTRYGRFHVRGRTKLFWSRCRERAARLQQRHIKMHIKAAGKHRVGLTRLAGLATHATVLELEFPGRAVAAAAEHRAARAGAPAFEFARLLKH